MITALNKISFRTTRILIAVFYSLSVATHVLVIGKIIPYTWVSGGMSKTYQDQAAQSAASIFLISLMFVFIWSVSKPKTKPTTLQIRILYVITGFWSLGLITQLLGTQFERYVLSIVILIGVVAHIRLIYSFHTPKV